MELFKRLQALASSEPQILGLSKRQLAYRLGIGESTLQREMKAWEVAGLIERSGGRSGPGSVSRIELKSDVSRTPKSDVSRDIKSSRKTRHQMMSKSTKSVASDVSALAGARYSEPLRGSKSTAVAGACSEPASSEAAGGELTLKLLGSQRRVKPFWFNANAIRLPVAEVKRLMAGRGIDKRFKKQMLDGFAKALEGAYRARVKNWFPTSNIRGRFIPIAEQYCLAYIDRGFSITEFMDAAWELKPKNQKNPPLPALGGWLGEKIREWLPPSQRYKGPETWTENGVQYMDTPDGPVPIN